MKRKYSITVTDQFGKTVEGNLTPEEAIKHFMQECYPDQEIYMPLKSQRPIKRHGVLWNVWTVDSSIDKVIIIEKQNN